MAGLLAASGFFLYANTSVKELTPVPDLLQPADKGMDLRMSGIQLVENREGRRLWNLQARSAENRAGEPTIALHDLTIHFYSERTQGVPVVMTADEGLFNRASHDLTVWGNVVVQKRDGESDFRTTEMTWISKTDRIETTKPVSIRTPRYTVDARGLSSTTDLDTVELKEQVRAVFFAVDATERAATLRGEGLHPAAGRAAPQGLPAATNEAGPSHRASPSPSPAGAATPGREKL